MVLKCNRCGLVIDKELVPLIKILNDFGLITRFCCRGHSNREFAYIMFSPYVIRGVEVGQVGEDTVDGVTLRWNFKYEKDAPIVCMECRRGRLIEVDEDAKDSN